MVFIPAETLSEAQSDTSSYDLDIDSVEDFNVGSLSHRNDDLFEIRETEYRGQGMFATQDIEPGTVILREEPLIVMPDRIFQKDDVDDIEEWLEKKLLKMDAQKRQTFFDLSDARSDNGDKTILGIFFTNDMSFIDESAALFPVMARVNHSCCNTADFISRIDLGVQDLVSTRLIKKGQEIFISYLPASAEGSADSKVRQEYTQHWYGFACKCVYCTQKTSESIRKRVDELQKSNLKDLSMSECSELIENLININCKLPHQNLVCQTGLEKALAENDWKMAVQFMAAGYLNDSILNGDDSTNVWTFVANSKPVSIDNEIYLFPSD